jgi:hypothetical protein
VRSWVCAAACLLFCPLRAFGWGERGHEQASGAAVELVLQRHRALANLLAPNAALLRRLAVTPDRDWKTSERGLDRQEQSLHYFEVDAFIAAERDPAAIMSLPRGEYLDVYPHYRNLLAANLKFLERLAPDKPRDPAAHGTAPWRVLQLHDAAAAALRRRDRAGALLALGTMAHYIADLAQPLHSTVDYDGARGGVPAAGVHAAFESRMLALEGDPGAVLAAAAAALGRRGLEPLPRDKVLRELFALVRDGYPMVRPLLEAYSRLRPEDGSPGEVPDSVVAAFAAAPLSWRSGRTEHKTTVFGGAQGRLGAAAALTARLWVSAFETAGSPHLGPGVVRFEDLRVLDRYPVPEYLPAPDQPEVRAPSAAVETITPLAEVLADKKKHDKTNICVKGTAAVLFRKTSRKGNAYFTFWLNEGSARVKVHSFGVPDFGEGEEVEACGRFTIEKRLSGRIFHDQISAQIILRGRQIGAGYVELAPAGVLPVKR